MRVKYGKARRRKKKRIFKEAKGNFGGRSKLWRTVQETILRSRAYAYRDRRVRKRDFRSLWITRITAAARARGLRYSELMYGLRMAEIEVNRKILSELAIHNPEIFDELVAKAQAAITKK